MMPTVAVSIALPAEILLTTEVYRSGAGVTIQCTRCPVARWTFTGHVELHEIISKALAHHNAFHGSAS